MSVAAVESRIAALQSGLQSVQDGSFPSSGASGADFAAAIEAQMLQLSGLGSDSGDPSSTDDSADSSLASALGTDGTDGTDSSDDIDGSDALSSLLGQDGSDPTSVLAALSGISGSGTSDGTSGTSSSGPTGTDVVADAERYLGVPYRWGGTNPKTGLDCSGLVQRVMGDLGVSMPRTVSEQRNVGQEIPSLSQAKPGDLLVFGSHHIGIYLGNGKMLHAPHTGDHVRISDVYETPTRIRRVVPSGATSSTSPTYDVRPAALRQSTSASDGSAYAALFQSATQKYNLPSGLLKAVASVESSFRADAVSPAGAEGLMQLMPGTARSLGVNPMNPSQAVDGAARMLKGLIHEFGSTKLAVAAYNAGAGAVKKYGGVPPYSETRTYVQRVLSRMES